MLSLDHKSLLGVEFVFSNTISMLFQEPEAVIVMLNNDLVAIDCKSPGNLCFSNPYAMNLNESPVTCCKYYADCPGELIPALYMVGLRAKKEGSKELSSAEWPICGGLVSHQNVHSFSYKDYDYNHLVAGQWYRIM